MAVADYTFFTYGDVNGMYGMLQGVVMLMGSNGYNTIIHLMLLLGGVLMLLYMMGIGVHAHRGWKWLITVTLMSSVLFGPKSVVAIEDATGIQSPAIIEGVPTALAFFFGVKSSAGYKLTELAETAFQTIPPVPPPGVAAVDYTLPAEMSYLKNGMMFGARVMQSTRSATFIDPTVKSLVVNYVKDCVIPSMGHLITYSDLMNSTDVWATMANTNKALFGTVIGGDGQFQSKPCDEVYAIVSLSLDADVNRIITRMGKFMYPQASPTIDAGDLIRPAITATYAKSNLMSAAASANAVILQNAMINSIGDAAGAMAVQMGDTSSILQSWAKQQSTVSLNASLIAQGETVGAALPIAKNILDMLMIAAFPVVCLLLLATEGEMLRSLGVRYILAMVWTELWPFLYAAVSFIGNTYAMQRAGTMGVLPSGNGMALINADAIYSGTISDLAMVGWAMTLVPVISGAIVYGFDRMVSTGGGIGQLGAGAGVTAGSAATGNASGGIVNFDKYDGAMVKTDPAMVRRDTVSGVSYENAMNPSASSSRWEARTGSSPVSMNDVMQLSTRDSARSSLAYSQGSSQMTSARAALSTHLVDAIRYAEGKGDTKTAARLAEASNSEKLALSSSEEDGVIDKVAAELGIKASESNKRELKQALATSFGVSMKTPGAALLPSVDAELRHTLTSSGSKANDNTIENALKNGVENMKSIKVQKAQEIVDSARRASTFTEGDESGKRLSDELGADLTRSREFTKSAERSFREAKEYGQSSENARSMASDFSFNLIGEYLPFAFEKTRKDPNTLTREEHQQLLPEFIKLRTMAAQDDKGSFRALNLFSDVAKVMPGDDWKLTNGAGTYSGAGLETEYRDEAKRPLDSVTLPNSDPNARAVVNQYGKNEGTVRAGARKAGISDTTPVPKPPEVGTPGATKPAEEVHQGASGQIAAHQEEIARKGQAVRAQQAHAATNPPQHWSELRNVETQMPEFGKKPPAPSGADLIPAPAPQAPSGVNLIPVESPEQRAASAARLAEHERNQKR